MKLIESVLRELGADGANGFTVIPSFGAYFCGVKQISEFSEQKIVLVTRGAVIAAEGDNLSVEKYFEEDAFIKGDIKVIKFE